MAKTATKTAAKTEEKPKVEVKAFSKAVSIVRSWKEGLSKVASLFDQIGQTVRDEAQRLRYDETQTRAAVFLTLEEAYEFDGDEGDKEKFRKRFQTEVSKILRIAFPKDANAEKNLEFAREHNKEANLHDRVGANDLLEIARGNKTFKQVRDHKATKKAAKGKFTLELFSSNVAAEISKARKNGITLAKAQAAVERLFSQWEKQETETDTDEETED